MTGDNSAAVDFVFAFALFSFKVMYPCQIPAAGHRGSVLGAA